MKTFRVRLKREWVEWHETTVEAESEEEALEKAEDWVVDLPDPRLSQLTKADSTLTIDGSEL